MPAQQFKKDLTILKAVAEIHRSVGANLELEKIAPILVEKLIQTSKCDGCAILLLNEEKVTVLAEEGFTKNFQQVELTVDSPAIKFIMETKQSIFSGNLPDDPIAGKCVPAGCKMRSIICVPIMVKGKVKGIIHLDSRKRNAFDRKDLEFAGLISSEVSLILERAFLYEEVRSLSIRDHLTGCYNRRKMDEDLQREVLRSQRYGNKFSLLLIDVDWFKKYNDFHGHQKGDQLLQRLCYLFLKNTRNIDGVYRYGGEEFLVLLMETDTKSALKTAERIKNTVQREKFEGEEKSQPRGKITISIGVATLPSHGNTMEEIINSADAALYKAKKSGRNRVVVFQKNFSNSSL